MDTGNPFESHQQMSRKRGAEESGFNCNGVDAEQQHVDHATAAHGVMPLPKRRLTDVNVPTMASMNNNSDANAYHAFDQMPHSPQHSLSLYPNQLQSASPPGVNTDAMAGYGYYSGTIAVENQQNGQVDPNSKHVLRHIQMPNYNPSAPSSSLNSPSAHSVFTSTTDADAPFLFEHDSPDMMRDEDTSNDPSSASIYSAYGEENANNAMQAAQMQQYQQQQQQQQFQFQQQAFQQQQQQQLEAFQQGQQQQQQHPLDPAAQSNQQHPMSAFAGSGMFTTQNPIQAAYDSYNGGFLDEFEDDAMSRRYTGQNGGDDYAARLENIMGHA